MARPVLTSMQGYTLLETVVALSILVGILIPLMMLAGNLMYGEISGEVLQALRIAETEMSATEMLHDYTDKTLVNETGLTLERKVDRSGHIVEATITVVGKNRKTILVLNKSWIEYE